ncbi:bacterial proteasome activator family protein [Naumannella cuiyingiana]|uniref:Bacterial proteasome activator n=1 Tax=Naumannella cuiyingiana TaxID=1347891 RepID=A0A7Z0D973_9ACTN|nr:hypothetical protein [Naumannella cuiyingiana]
MTQQPDPQQPQADQQPAGGAAGEGQPQVIAGATGDGRGFIVGPQGMAVERAPGTEGEEPSVTDQVEEPAKVMRIGNMIRALLEEVRSTPLDDPSRERLREVYGASIDELKSGLSEDLAAELERITEPFTADETPSNDELRIAKAQLVGWLEGLFQGIQTALVAQQMAARAQLEQMRRTLPGGPQPGQPQAPQRPAGGTDGMYL